MSRAQGGRKEPLLPRDGVEAKPHALTPSHSLHPPPGTLTPRAMSNGGQTQPELGSHRDTPLSKKSPPHLTHYGLPKALCRTKPCPVTNPPPASHIHGGEGGAVVMGGNIS